MKNTITIVIVAAIVSVGIGFLGFSIASNQSEISSQSLVSTALMNGHFRLVVTDNDGNIKAYRQSDNAITTKGENCVAKILFAGPATGSGSQGTAGCTGALNQPWTFLGVGTGSGADTGVATALTTELAASGLTRALATSVVITNSTTGGEASTYSKVVLSKAFSVVTTAQTVTEAGLFNETAASQTDSMFARKVFTGVAVNPGDTLTVSWTINIGNTTANIGVSP